MTGEFFVALIYAVGGFAFFLVMWRGVREQARSLERQIRRSEERRRIREHPQSYYDRWKGEFVLPPSAEGGDDDGE